MALLKLVGGGAIGVRRGDEVVEVEVDGHTVSMTLLEAALLSELIGDAASRR